MTREEAIELKAAAGRLMYSDNKDIRDYNMLIDFIESTLRPISQEQIEKVRGEWEFDAAATDGKFGGIRCSKCHTACSFGGEHAFHNAKNFEHFCPHCGAPMTDKSMEIVMKRLEDIYA